MITEKESWFGGASGFGVTGIEVEVAVSVSATANVEKCVTTNVQMHCPSRKDPVHDDITSGSEAASPALSSDTAKPCGACQW